MKSAIEEMFRGKRGNGNHIQPDEERNAYEAYLFYKEGFRFGVIMGIDVSEE